MTDDPRLPQIIERLKADRPRAHRELFADRHQDQSPDFHIDLLNFWHGRLAYVQFWAFRGGAKSTLGEEAVLLGGCLREYHNCLVVGSSLQRATQRVESIAYEAENNEILKEIFGPLVGTTWAEDRIVLSNGVIIQAIGRGQKLRGIKHRNWRPDLVVLDDVNEDEESRDPVVQQKTIKWFFSTLLPACDPKARIRMAETPRDPEGLPVRLKNNPQWTTRVYPIEYPGPTGERTPQWPSRFPLEKIDELKALYESEGRHIEYRNEYLCVVDTGRPRDFTDTKIRVEPQVRTWEPVYAMVDPARTVNRMTSATTGYAVWSWVVNRLVVWEAYGLFHKPDELLNEIFKIDEKYRPVHIGVEEDGLNEFILQPLRHAMIKHGRAIPVKAMKAPRSKMDFILGLQPFFNSGEATLAQECPDLRSQLLSFPSGRVDVPNALAYALKLRPGLPIYEDFTSQHVVERVLVNPTKPLWLACNATSSMTTAALVQMYEGRMAIVADWCMEGEPGSTLGVIMKEAGAEGGGRIRTVLPPQHYDKYMNFGLVQAARAAMADMHKGVDLVKGKEEIRSLLKTQGRGMPSFQISHEARWSLNAMAGGYARATMKTGGVADWPEEGPYRTLMEGLESFAGLMKVHQAEDDGLDQRRYATARDGRRYQSALATRR